MILPFSPSHKLKFVVFRHSNIKGRVKNGEPIA